ncbi:hypothetical protein KFU94_17660 [Chloroflexi bacterium TSY]|nr:hypothetical protein [Chloroflexi bacterium TSY]
MVSVLAIIFVGGFTFFVLNQTLTSAFEPKLTPTTSNATRQSILAVEAARETPTPTSTPAVIATPQQVLPTDTSDLSTGERTVVELVADGAVWWLEEDRRPNYRDDSYLYAGQWENRKYLSSTYFDLSEIPRGAPIHQVRLSLTGLRDDRFNQDVNALWSIQLIAESPILNSSKSLVSFDYETALGVSASPPILPYLEPTTLQVGSTNYWVIERGSNEDALGWLEKQILEQNNRLYARISALGMSGETLFAWDSGYGKLSSGRAPKLSLVLGPPPTSEPPTSTPIFKEAIPGPTRDDLLAKWEATLTAVAVETLYPNATPTPYIQVFTPTPFPANVETAQAIGLQKGLLPIIAHTPTPVNQATTIANALLETARAEIEGTSTPLPENYITPVWVTPTPTPVNIATQVALLEAAQTAVAAGVKPILPDDGVAVVLRYMVATPTALNFATSIAIQTLESASAEFLGPSTPIPPGVLVVTRTPTPLPTSTPTLPPIITAGPTDTPTITPTAPPGIIPEFYNKIVFNSVTDTGSTQKVYDPISGAVIGKITLPWLTQYAQEQLVTAPDGRAKAVVAPDESRDQSLQIQVVSFDYNTQTTISPFRGDSYDPAWSPTGQYVAFVSSADAGNDELYLIDTYNNNEVKRLTYTEGVWEKHPTWSPDGSQIVFHSNRTGVDQLWIMNVDGSNQRQLLNSGSIDRYPIWIRSP